MLLMALNTTNRLSSLSSTGSNQVYILQQRGRPYTEALRGYRISYTSDHTRANTDMLSRPNQRSAHDTFQYFEFAASTQLERL